MNEEKVTEKVGVGSGISGTSMISFVKGKTEISLNFPNRHR